MRHHTRDVRDSDFTKSAVMLYRRGESISNILWRLGLRLQSTLESYLQEMAASAVFASSVRQRLRDFADIQCLHV